jgi:hypothetical protein
MFEFLKKIFTKSVQLTSDMFQKAEVIFEEEKQNTSEQEPKIKRLKKQISYRTKSKYR